MTGERNNFLNFFLFFLRDKLREARRRVSLSVTPPAALRVGFTPGTDVQEVAVKLLAGFSCGKVKVLL